jgi:hypothetical protein
MLKSRGPTPFSAQEGLSTHCLVGHLMATDIPRDITVMQERQAGWRGRPQLVLFCADPVDSHRDGCSP